MARTTIAGQTVKRLRVQCDAYIVIITMLVVCAVAVAHTCPTINYLDFIGPRPFTILWHRLPLLMVLGKESHNHVLETLWPAPPASASLCDKF